MASERNFTHEEIWDDSALVVSWNNALAEYNASTPPSSIFWCFLLTVKHRNITAFTPKEAQTKPRTVTLGSGSFTDSSLGHPAVPKLKQMAMQHLSQQRKGRSTRASQWTRATKHRTQQPRMPNTPQMRTRYADQTPKMQAVGGGLSGGQPAVPLGPGPGPQVLLGSVQDEELKKLLMSWYYAGYYTGLYEGKQQGLKQAQQQDKSS
uniref:Uncharacterized protein n=1 Tax=Podospora anserina (strain S / ATCC MYA-4624 / DSM 980 / FGSC 10383) TaxID=515849 RepID=A0A090CG89_PODAN|nr:Putative protein of unknown function [Podospora anserina S mat+]